MADQERESPTPSIPLPAREGRNLGYWPARAKGLGERAFVEIVELSSDRKSMGQLADADWKSFQSLGQIVGRGLAFEGRVHRQHDLVDPVLGDATDELVDGEVLGPNALQRRQQPP